LTGPWHEHPRSPLIAHDPCRARPAGRVVESAGRLFRFAQDCANEYGRLVRPMEITKLTTAEYEERELAFAQPLGPGPMPWNAGGMHHVDVQLKAAGQWVAAVDGWHWGNCGY
jgi:hypothetical protein